MSITPAARHWCREQLLRLYPQWPVQEHFLPPAQAADLLLLQGLLAAMLQIPLAASAIEVSAPKLGWWAGALQRLLQIDTPSSLAADATALDDVMDQASLQHPALRCLPGSRALTFLRAIPLREWLLDVQLALETQALADTTALQYWCWRLARPLHWLDAWCCGAEDFRQALAQAATQDRPTAGLVHARRLLLQQINTLPHYNWLYHTMPLSLRARHRLQLDPAPSLLQDITQSRPQQAWRCPAELLADLLRLDAELLAATAVGMELNSVAMQQRWRFWQAGNLALARSLRQHIGSGHERPVSGIGPGLLWSSWRSARALRAQG